MMICASAATVNAASSPIAPHYLLLYPRSTIETDAGGRCVRLTNVSESLVYLALTEIPLADAVKAYPYDIKAQDCTPR